MANPSLLIYNGQEVFFKSLAHEVETTLLNLPDTPFIKGDLESLTPEFYLSKGYISFISFDNPNFERRLLKINKSKNKGKFIKISDSIIYLNQIAGICQFCIDQEANDIVTRSTFKIQKYLIFQKEFLGCLPGEKFNYVGMRVNTPYGNISIDKLIKDGYIKIYKTEISNGRFSKSSTSYYGSDTPIIFTGENVEIGCLTFNLKSLQNLAEPLKKYLAN